MEELVGHSLRRQHISAVLLSAFALGALLLAAMGLYGVVAGAVMRRRHELALRLAVGADHRALLRLVLQGGESLVMAGVLMGAPTMRKPQSTGWGCGSSAKAAWSRPRPRCAGAWRSTRRALAALLRPGFGRGRSRRWMSSRRWRPAAATPARRRLGRRMRGSS